MARAIADGSDPVAPANNPKPGNTFSAGACPRRRNLDLESNRILARTAIASGVARLHARPGALRGARGDHGRGGSRLRVNANAQRQNPGQPAVGRFKNHKDDQPDTKDAQPKNRQSLQEAYEQSHDRVVRS